MYSRIQPSRVFLQLCRSKVPCGSKHLSINIGFTSIPRYDTRPGGQELARGAKEREAAAARAHQQVRLLQLNLGYGCDGEINVGIKKLSIGIVFTVFFFIF